MTNKLPRAQGVAVFLRKSLLILRFAIATLRAGIHPRCKASGYSARLITNKIQNPNVKYQNGIREFDLIFELWI